MNESGTACACLTVKYRPANQGGIFVERWVCDDCGMEFSKLPGLASPYDDGVEKIRKHLAACSDPNGGVPSRDKANKYHTGMLNTLLVAADFWKGAFILGQQQRKSTDHDEQQLL